MSIKKRIVRIKNKLLCKISPVKYAKSLGVKIGGGGKIYSSDVGMWSTEPWLITIGENVHITYGVRFITHDGGTLVIDYHEYGSEPFVICGDIVVGNNVYIGERTTVLPGVKIGDNVIIGAGSVVAKDIPSNTVAAGVPCKPINTRESYVLKLKDIIAGNNPRYYQDLEYMHSLNPNRK